MGDSERELWMADGCSDAGRESYSVLFFAPTATSLAPRQPAGGLTGRVGVETLDVASHRSLAPPERPWFSDNAISIMKNFCEFFSVYIRNHLIWEFNEVENRDSYIGWEPCGKIGG